MSFRFRALSAVLSAAVVASAAPTFAQSADAGSAAQEPAAASGLDLKFSGGVTFSSDYVARGFSLNDRQGVVQGFIEGAIPLTDKINLVGGVWASSLDKDVQRGGSEVDPYVGLTGDLGEGKSWRVAYWRVTFPDAPVEQDFNEYIASYTFPVGPVSTTLFALYDDYDVGDSLFMTVTGVYPIANTPFSIKGVVGYEDGINWDDKVNWSIGGLYDYRGVTFSLSYVDTNRFLAKSNDPAENVADGNVVFAVSKSF